MKKLVTLLAVFVFIAGAKAQYVNIPDSNFRSFLKAKYPECFNVVGQMDTTCSSVITEDTLWITFNQTSYISTSSDLDGLQYFKTLLNFGFYGTYQDTVTLNITEIPKTVREIQLNYVKAITSLATFPDSLKKIYFSDCFHQSAVPEFPQGVKEITFSGGGMINLPALPDSLTRLLLYSCRNLDNLSSFPANLKFLFLNYCTNISALPSLPASLDTLFCNNNQLRNLPDLPINLRRLDCSYNKLLSLPQLPDSLKYLDCGNNDSLAAIPSLPEGLIFFMCQNYLGLISSLPPLPSSLTSLICTGNKLRFLPELPPNIVRVDCSINELQALPSIPASIRSLLFHMNKIRVLPELPNSLRELSCGMNPLYTLPNHLPDSLESLGCGSDSLSSLPLLPPNLISLSCNDNLLTSLPPLPNLGYLYCKNNNIYCLPKLPLGRYNETQFFIDMDKITCIPNQGPYVKFMIPNPRPIGVSDYWIAAPPIPLCNPTNNVNHCQSFPIVSGNVFYDNNINGIKDPNENYKSNIKFELSNGAIAYSNNNGYFEIGTDSLGTYTITPIAPNYFSIIPTSATYNFTTYDTIVSKDYALQANTIKDSFAIKLTPLNWAARPGFSFPYFISYENAGTTTLSPNIVFNYDDTRLTYDSSSNSGVINNGNNLSLSAGSFVPGQQGNFTAYFKAKTTAAIGDSLFAKATISDNAVTAADSSKILIRGSYDPNDKQATPELSPLQVANGTYIDYTIRFQNTGNDTAFNVVISDTLASELLVNTLKVAGSSHTCKTTVKDNIVFFEFLNILLPDSNVNEIKSHGFVSFKIKPHPSVPSGETINNKAAIYFDYNAPVITNIAGTFIKPFTVVPVKLISFSAVPQSDNTTTLYWNTANEINTKQFVIEQSSDGIKFNSTRNIIAKGKTNNNYSANVADANTGIVFYRLKIVDNDGTFSFSPILKIDRRKNTAGFSVLTNPVKDFIIINTTDRSLNNTTANIINMQGAVVKNFIVKQGSQTVDINGLPKGVYYLRTVNGSSRVIVQ